MILGMELPCIHGFLLLSPTLHTWERARCQVCYKHSTELISFNRQKTPEASTDMQTCRQPEWSGACPMSGLTCDGAGVLAQAFDLRAHILDC